jgi:hypothetical protein
MVIVTKIKAIREDPKDPHLDCYSTNDVATLAALEISKVFANNPILTTPPKKEDIMSNPSGLVDSYSYSYSKAPKRHVPGIGSASPARLVDTLSRLGLVPSNLVDPLKTLSAHGKPLAPYFTVSIDELDMALNGVECSTENRIRFKQALVAAGLLSTKR